MQKLYRKIHYLTREFRVKLHAKTVIGFQVQFYAEFPRQVMNFSWIALLNKILERKKKNSNKIVWFYSERALQKAIQSQLSKQSFC